MFRLADTPKMQFISLRNRCYIKTQMSELRFAPLIFPNTENLKLDIESSRFNSTDLKKLGERLFLFPELK